MFITSPVPERSTESVSKCNTLTTREIWCSRMLRMFRPILENLADKKLKRTMPYRCRPEGWKQMKPGSCNEAFGRTICGIAPWLHLKECGDPAEARLLREYREMTRKAVANAVNPESEDFLLSFPLDPVRNQQFLVDVAFFAQGLLRAPEELYTEQPQETREQILHYLKAVRVISPSENNWLLFSAMVETALHRFTGDCQKDRVEYALHRHNEWFKGDGIYGDGPLLAFDYYNSFVIHPMLFDILLEWGDDAPCGPHFRKNAFLRSTRYAAILERMIMPDGSFPVIGRSSCYRSGVFHHLANMVLHHALPAGLHPGSVRGALTAVIEKILSCPGTYDENGFLNIGICGHQPDAGEPYISTGSLYLAGTVFLPLGLPANDPFWTEPETPWTQKRCWSSDPRFSADHAVQDEKEP